MPVRRSFRRGEQSVHVQRNLTSAPGVPVALTIGNFDGVHRGHQAMLSRLVEAAEDLRLPPAVLTFEPHPREFFAPGRRPPRLSTLRAKLELFRAYGVRRRTSRVSMRARVAHGRRVHRRTCSCAGCRRTGCWSARISVSARPRRATSRCCARRRARLQRRSDAHGDVDGERASSTAVREALAAGDLDARGGAAGPPVRDHRARGAWRQAAAAISAFRRPTAAAAQAAAYRASSPCACTAWAAAAHRCREPRRATHGRTRRQAAARSVHFRFRGDASTDSGSRSSSCTSCATRRSTTTSTH